MRILTGAKFIFRNADELERNKLNVGNTKVEMLRWLGCIRIVNVLRRVKNPYSENYMLVSFFFAVTPLTLYRNFAFHVMVWSASSTTLNSTIRNRKLALMVQIRKRVDDGDAAADFHCQLVHYGGNMKS